MLTKIKSALNQKYMPIEPKDKKKKAAISNKIIAKKIIQIK